MFTSLLIAIRRHHLNSFQGKIIKYIWGKKDHRLARHILYSPKTRGGLGLPDLFRYYQAARLAQLSTVYFRYEKPDWINIERQAVPAYTLDFLLWCPIKSRPPVMSPTLSHSFKLWDDMKHLPTLISDIRPLDHIFHNPRFSPGMDIKSFHWWLDKGMYRIGHYFSLSGLISMKHCVEKLPDSEKFRFLQISHFLSTLRKNNSTPPEFTQYERWCGQALEQKGGISILYTSLLEPTAKFPYMEAWERDLQETWGLEEWHKRGTRAFKGILNISLIEANLKVLMRWYLVPSRLALMFASTSPLCFRDCQAQGSMLHIWWECPRLRGYWNKIFNLIRRVSHYEIPPHSSA